MEERVVRTATSAPAPEQAAPQRPTRTVRRRAEPPRRTTTDVAPTASLVDTALAAPATGGGVVTGVAGRISPLVPAAAPLAPGAAAPLRRDLEEDGEPIEHDALARHHAPSAPRRTIRRAHRPTSGGPGDAPHRAAPPTSGSTCRVRPLASPSGTASSRSVAAATSTASPGVTGHRVVAPIRRSIVPGGSGRSLTQQALGAAPAKVATKYAPSLANAAATVPPAATTVVPGGV